MGRKTKIIVAKDKNFEDECRRIVMDNLANVEAWLERLGRSDPAAALKIWANLAEFIEAKKARDARPSSVTNISVKLIPAERKQLNQKLDDYIEISEVQNE